MDSRERVALALEHRQPDRPPVFATFVPEVERRLRDERRIADGDLGVALGNDLVKACVGLENSFNGTPGQVREAVARLASGCGAGGGYILAPAHHIQADTPSANIAAFYEAALAGGSE
jgi:hypothetical protein